MILPSTLFDLDGLEIGVIGLANISSLNSIYDESNSMGIRFLEPEDIIPEQSALLRSQGADIVIAVSHMGLHDDIEHAQLMDDVDIYMGGHHHIAIDPPLVVTNEETENGFPWCTRAHSRSSLGAWMSSFVTERS